MTPTPVSPRLVVALRLLLAMAMGAGVAFVIQAWRQSARGDHVMPGVRLGDRDVGGKPISEVRRAEQAREMAFLEQTVTISTPTGQERSTYHSLGVIPRSDGLWDEISRVGRRGGFFRQLAERRRARSGRLRFAAGYGLNPDRALAALGDLKARVDSRARRARLDLVNRRIVPGQVGYALDVYESQERILAAAREGRRELELAVRKIRTKLSEGQVQDLNIGTVMGWYETSYSLSPTYANRTYNLRVAARKLSGTILMPDEVFDFNVTLGPRTQQEGYRIAPVIARGELVDGIAGGVCQISSTIFAAAFFAGLDVVKAEVHSMPSHYIELGLDATVVWPEVNLLLRNPYDFPVVLNLEVNSGRVRGEVLGRERPYKIGFERRIIGDKAFKEEIRQDEHLLLGKRQVEQRGQRGYTVRRRRIFFDFQGHEVRSQYWTAVYPPTTMILKLGTRKEEDPDAPPPEELKPVNPMPDPATFVRKIQ